MEGDAGTSRLCTAPRMGAVTDTSLPRVGGSGLAGEAVNELGVTAISHQSPPGCAYAYRAFTRGS
jgi:hypothetical protein